MICLRARSTGCWTAVLFACLSAAAQPAFGNPQAQAPKEQEKQNFQFLRVARDDAGNAIALQVAVVRYAPVDPRRRRLAVDLVGALHVAEKGYYDRLNRDFKTYDAVLYELVAPEGAQVPKATDTRSNSMVSAFQHAMKDALKLEFQLDHIDYDAKNLVHADMSPKQFAESMKRRGETVLGMFLRMLAHAMMRQQGSSTSDWHLLMALFDKNRALALKRVLAEQFEDMEGMLAFDGPKGSTLISERNKVALEVLKKEIATGKKKLAIFYGAGHMPDFQKRLGEDFNLKPVGIRWLDAWHLREKPGSDKRQ